MSHFSKEQDKLIVKMRDMCGEDCLQPEDGESTYRLIHPALKASEKVTLDFSGVRVVVSLFLNSAIGKLYADVSPESIRENLSIVGLNPAGKFALRRVIENSKSYYSDARMRDAVDHSINILEA